MTATAPAARRRRSPMSVGAWPLLFVGPLLLGVLIFYHHPIIGNLVTSFTTTNAFGGDVEFVGLDNYTQALGDKSFWNSLWLTVIFVGFSGVLGQTLLGFTLAWSTRRIAGWARTVLESVVLAAWVIPGSVHAFLWIALLDRRGGTLNALLGTEGKAWLIENPMTIIIIFNIWVGTAFSMQLFSSALSAVPPSQMESARMAGASGWEQLRDVVLPNIRGHVLTNTLMITLWTFNTFTPYLLTAGGPNGKTEILSVYIYKTAIPGGQLGFGAAISMIMLLINLAIALLYMRIGRSKK